MTTLEKACMEVALSFIFDADAGLYNYSCRSLRVLGSVGGIPLEQCVASSVAAGLKGLQPSSAVGGNRSSSAADHVACGETVKLMMRASNH
jgi:hypothetical protein